VPVCLQVLENSPLMRLFAVYLGVHDRVRYYPHELGTELFVTVDYATGQAEVRGGTVPSVMAAPQRCSPAILQ
jgi:hypothetical protein